MKLARVFLALVLSVLYLTAVVGVSRAGERRLGVAPDPDALDVTATTWVDVFQLPGQATNTAFMGGGLQLWVCAASVTIKDAAQAQLKTRVLFNGAVGSLAETKTGADGSVSRLYMIVNPPGGGAICQTKLQVAKTSGNIALRAAPAPPEEDILLLNVPTPVN